MNAYFCTVSGVRIVAPGVSKSVDPRNGQDEFSESPSGPDEGAKAQEQPASAGAGSESKPDEGAKAQEQPASAGAGSESKPNKGAK